MRILKALPIVSAILLLATFGCVRDKVAKSDTTIPPSSSTENNTPLTPTSDRSGEPHIYSNATSRAVSPPLDQSSNETP